MTDEEILKMIEKYDTTDKLTWTDEIIKAQHDHEKAEEAEKTAPKQMSIFEFMEDENGRTNEPV